MATARLPLHKRLDTAWCQQQTRVRDSPVWWLLVAGMLWTFGLVFSGMAQNIEMTMAQNASAQLSEVMRAQVDKARTLLGELTVIVRFLDTLGVAIVGIVLVRYLRKAAPKSLPGVSLSSRMFIDSPCAMVISDLQDVILDVNPAYERLTGYRQHEVVGMPMTFNHAGQFDDESTTRMRHRLAEQGAWEGQFWLRNRSGEAFSEKVVRRVFHNRQSNTQCLLTVSLDSAGSEEEMRLMIWQAHHDTLTKLPNRNLLQERFTRVLMNLKPGSRGVVLSIDLDDFKIFNDSFGAAKGDLLLTQAAFRIALAVQETDTVARMAGDHFAVLVEKIEDYAEAERLARAILEQVNLPYLEDGQEATLTASIGICVFPDDGSECGELLQRADAAQARIKVKGGNGFAFFESAMNQEAQHRLELVSTLRKAIREDQLLLHFQPVIDLRDGSVDIKRLGAQVHELAAHLRQVRAQLGGERREVAQLATAQTRAGDFVGVTRTDATQGGADFGRALVGFECGVERLVARQHQVRAVADQQAWRGIDTARDEFVEFIAQREGVDHHTVADDARGLVVQDTGWQQVQDRLLTFDHHRVAGVGAALATHYHIGARGKQVDDLALALVAPLQTQDHLVFSFRVLGFRVLGFGRSRHNRHLQSYHLPPCGPGRFAHRCT